MTVVAAGFDRGGSVYMSLTAAQKSEIIKEFGASAQDTGSTEVQIALLTKDIGQLTAHFKLHPKDHHSRSGLIRKVNLRRTLLAYLKKHSLERYRSIIGRLGLRG